MDKRLLLCGQIAQRGGICYFFTWNRVSPGTTSKLLLFCTENDKEGEAFREGGNLSKLPCSPYDYVKSSVETAVRLGPRATIRGVQRDGRQLKHGEISPELPVEAYRNKALEPDESRQKRSVFKTVSAVRILQRQGICENAAYLKPPQSPRTSDVETFVVLPGSLPSFVPCAPSVSVPASSSSWFLRSFSRCLLRSLSFGRVQRCEHGRTLTKLDALQDFFSVSHRIGVGGILR